MPEKKSVTDLEFGILCKTLFELQKRIREGTLDCDRAYDKIIDLLETTPEKSIEDIRVQAKNCIKRHPKGNGCVFDAEVNPEAYIASEAIVGGGAKIGEGVKILNRAIVWGNIIIEGKVEISGNAFVTGSLWIFGDIIIKGYVTVIGRDPTTLQGNLEIGGSGTATLKGDYRDGKITVK